MLSHLDSLWNRGTRKLGNGLLKFKNSTKDRAYWLKAKTQRNLHWIIFHYLDEVDTLDDVDIDDDVDTELEVDTLVGKKSQ